MIKDENCPLCIAERKTRWFHEDDLCYICECSSCGIPMIVFKYHYEPEGNELEHLEEISKELFPDKSWRGIRRDIKDHWHEHLID